MPAILRLVLPVLLLALWIPGARAADEVLVKLTIKDHRFSPERLEIPARTKVVLLIRNEDAEPEEFECVPLRREKIVFPGGEIRVVLGKVDPGEYPFFGEYHAATAKGIIVAK
ncbi:cupredoxin domain-containing protein [Magnetospirillum sp. 15-1]|uniref:cupredoxin domain-containing protein n=1 Tax=Magnetospirillum sp. 15-1 TaxID=1979370 RepID=UPI000BBCACE4|nr:cupredoxin domain-containing protein [Magnetospirillum sp. 15-1]